MRTCRSEYAANVALMQSSPAPKWPDINVARAAVARVRRQRLRQRLEVVGALLALIATGIGMHTGGVL